MTGYDVQFPLVSVLMTAFNREKYIAEAIESVLASTYTNFELIIVDDASKDDTVDVANRYAMKDERIKVYRNQQNLGDYPNRNHASTFASGKYIMYVDSDDKLNADAIEYIIEKFSSNPGVKFATIYQRPDIKASTVLHSVETIRKHFFDYHFLDNGPGGSIVERDFFNSIGRFPVKFGSANDMYYNIKAACNSDVLLLPYVYLFYRRHEGQEINDGYPYLYNDYLYMNEVLKLSELPISETERNVLYLKNKRRFLVHSIVFLKNTRKLKKFIRAYRLAGVGLKDIIKGILQ